MKYFPLRVLYQGKFLEFVRTGTWEFVRRQGSRPGVLIIPVTDEQRLVVIEHERPPAAGCVIELPAGTIECAETVEEAARRELRQETGFRCSSVERVAEGLTSPGMTDDRNILVIARGLVPGEGKAEVVGDGVLKHLRNWGAKGEQERLKVWEVPLTHIHQWLATQRQVGKNIDLRLYAGLSFLPPSL